MIQPPDELATGAALRVPGDAAPAPLSRQAPRLLAIARDERRTVGAVLGWDGGAWRALASLEGPAGPALEDDLRGLTAGLRPLLPQGERVPREALLLSRDVVSACVEVPGLAKLPPERVETIVGWELDPFVPGEPEGEADDGAAPVACGWSRAAGPGPVLASGVRPRARDAAREAFARAGLRLRGLYPLLGCAAAELPAGDGPSVVLELGRGAVFASRVDHGRVVRARLARCAPGGELEAALGLVSADAATVVAGPVEPALRAEVEAEGWGLLGAPDDLPPGLFGAARHALALPGGARLAAVPAARARRLRLPAPLGWTLLGAAVVAAAAGVVDVQVGRQLESARQALVEAEERADAGRRAQGLQASLGSLRAVHALEREVADRGRGLPAMVRDLAAAVPPALELRLAREEPTGLRLEGVSLDELSVSQFVAALAPRLKARGLVPGHPAVRPATGEPYYAFTVTFTRGGGGP